jgi:hypothetical protein
MVQSPVPAIVFNRPVDVDNALCNRECAWILAQAAERGAIGECDWLFAQAEISRRGAINKSVG